MLNTLVSTSPVHAVCIFMMMLRPNWTVRYLQRSIILSAFSTVTVSRLHPGSGLVMIYNWYLPSFVFISINIVLYGSIAEECVFMMPDVGQGVAVLETLFLMPTVRAVTRAARIVVSITVVTILSFLSSPSSCLLLPLLLLILLSS